ncbi:hypothetical protein [Amycolatopsis sp. 195334CR]|uniref:hypothetical protein n=1 Tax=Amycolatopsis sp. 195334CR TaxID=2814588 RepID=UPI001A8F1B0A|nr:hypothetical protein [Amycolatopsis sp. 195334CR]MBN6036200.1 hypothetical protein [Amycolatopsis sp. 195334CR]
MDFWGFVQLARRRWYVVLPALAVALGLTAFTYLSIPTRYSSSGTLVLTAPSTGAKVTADPTEGSLTNPLLSFDGSLVISAQIVSQILNDPLTKEQVGAGPESGSTYLANNGQTNGPFVFVTTEATSEQESRDLVARVLERARTELDNRQRAVQAPESTFIKAQELVQPTQPEPLTGGKIRFAGAALVLSLLLTLAGTFAFDSVARAMRRRREEAAEVAAEAKSEPRARPRLENGQPDDDATVFIASVGPLPSEPRR